MHDKSGRFKDKEATPWREAKLPERHMTRQAKAPNTLHPEAGLVNP